MVTKYYKNKKESTFIKRTGPAQGCEVQVFQLQNGDFTHLHRRTEYGSKEILDERLEFFTECTEEEYESYLAAFFQKTTSDREKFQAYRVRKFDTQKQQS